MMDLLEKGSTSFPGHSKGNSRAKAAKVESQLEDGSIVSDEILHDICHYMSMSSPGPTQSMENIAIRRTTVLRLSMSQRGPFQFPVLFSAEGTEALIYNILNRSHMGRGILSILADRGLTAKLEIPFGVLPSSNLLGQKDWPFSFSFARKNMCHAKHMPL